MYFEACEIAGACAHDGALSSEEELLLESLNLIATDAHPDAHALRLRLSLALRSTTCEHHLPWSAAEQLPKYIALWPRVSAGCRLPFAQELFLVRAAADEPSPPPPLLLHRAMLLQAAAAANAAGPVAPPMWLPAPTVVEPIKAFYFETRLTRSVYSDGGGRDGGGSMVLGDGGLAAAAGGPPAAFRLRERDWSDRVADVGWGFWTPPPAAGGVAALAKYNELLTSGITLGGSFLLVYALLCQQVCSNCRRHRMPPSA
jgi:hypothetical protein